jgi:RHO1 GDP-GTP exchange protein 1/2
LLEAVLKHTPDDNPDKEMLPKVIAIVREFLDRVNTESGRAENRFNLMQLDQQLVFRPGEKVVRSNTCLRVSFLLPKEVNRTYA